MRFFFELISKVFLYAYIIKREFVHFILFSVL